MRKWVWTGIAAALMSTNIFALDATALQAVQQYQQEFASTVPDHYKVTLSDEQTAKLKSEVLQYAPIQQLASPEFVVVVNRHPKGQSMSVVLADSQSVEVIGTSKVSTGMTQRKHYYLTPVGIFENKRENGTYRAEGTKNENGVRGLGKKGMRVFDFGWQPSHAGWGARGPADIRLQIHATDPDLLERRLGSPASKGCVRVQSEVNRFLDQYGVLDKHYQDAPAWMLSPNKKSSPYEGRFMVVYEDELSSAQPEQKSASVASTATAAAAASTTSGVAVTR